MAKQKLSEEQRKANALQELQMKEMIEEHNRLRKIAREVFFPYFQANMSAFETSRFCEWVNVMSQQAVMKMAQDINFADLELTKNLPNDKDTEKLQALIGMAGDQKLGAVLKILGAFTEGIKHERDVKTRDWTWEQIGLDLSDAPTPQKPTN